MIANKVRITKNKMAPRYGNYIKIGNYFFYENNTIGTSNLYDEFMYSFTIQTNENTKDIVAIDDYLKEISDFTFLLAIPKKESSLIEEFDHKLLNGNTPIFHNMRKHYVEVCEYNNISLTNNEINIVFIGITVNNGTFNFKIKAFNIDSVKCVTNSIISHMTSKFAGVNVYVEYNINWLTINQLKIRKTNTSESIKSLDKEKLLNITFNNEKECEYAFKKIWDKGYLTVEEIEKTVNGSKPIAKIKAMKTLFQEYLKLNIINDKNLLLHMEPAINYHQDERNNRIFSFNPRTLQHFYSCWHEDYIGEILKDAKSQLNIKSMEKNNIYNFFNDGIPNNEKEIDWLILVETNNTEKIVAIECKRTLSCKEIKDTIEKFDAKIIKSPNKLLIDGFILVSYIINESDKSKIESNYFKGNDHYVHNFPVPLSSGGTQNIPLIIFNSSQSKKTKNQLITYIKNYIT